MDFRDRPLGVIPSRKDFRDYHISQVVQIKPEAAFPAEFTVPHLPEKPYDQNGYGMCVAFALKAIREMQEAKERGARGNQLSAPWIYGMRLPDKGQYTGEGMEPRDALSNMVNFGVAPDQADMQLGNYPMCYTWVQVNLGRLSDLAIPNKIKTFVGMTKVDEIKTALMDLGPVLYCIPVYDSFYAGGNLQTPYYDEAIKGYHALTIVGWTKDNRWRILNSWGADWGPLKGYCTVPFNYPFSEIWSITDLVRQAVIEMTVGEMTYKVNGVEKQSDVAPFIQGDRTFVPLRFVSEALGAEVQWGETLRKIYIMK